MSLHIEESELNKAQKDFIDYRDNVNYKTMAIILYIEKLKDNKDVLKELKKY